MIHSGQSESVLDSIVDPMVLPDREIPGFISARLMAAWSLDDGFVVQVALHRVNERRRLAWHFMLERNGVVLVESDTLESLISATYSEVALSGLKELVTNEELPGRDHYVKELT